MSFEPVYNEHSRALILGTWPSPKSREMAFYYGHPQNRFWPMMAALTGEPVRALCGKMWVPGRDPQKFPVCPQCKEIYEGLAPGNDGDNGSGE